MTPVLFKIKFRFKEPNDKGELKRAKLDIIAQCENYSEAEQLAIIIAKDYEMDRSEPYSYEIIKLKLSVNDILYSDTTLDYQKDLVLGLVGTYLNNELADIYIVNILVFENEEIKTKSVKRVFCVPAYNAVGAINQVQSWMASFKYSQDEYKVINAKVDGASEIYFKPDTFDKLIKKD